MQSKEIQKTAPSRVLRYHLGEPTPVLALAVHAGHEIRDELVPRMAVSEDLRLYEEDPLTDRFARKFPIAAWATASRFEVDLNREEEKAVYMTPDMAWGIHVWNDPPTPEMKKRSLDRWHEGQRFVDGLVDRAVDNSAIAFSWTFIPTTTSGTRKCPIGRRKRNRPLISGHGKPIRVLGRCSMRFSKRSGG